MDSKTPIITARNLYKSFTSPAGEVQVLKDINLDIYEGEFVAILGPSGSGKTTFLHLCALLDKPTSGTFKFNGMDVSKMPDEEIANIRKHNVGMVFQRFQLMASRTVLQNVMFRFRYLEHDQTVARQKAQECLTMLKIDKLTHKPARLLSGGEMQRVAIARAVVVSPLLLVADEPTGNLDHISSIMVMECFQSLNKQGITILMATHNETLLGYCSRNIVFNDGMIKK